MSLGNGLGITFAVEEPSILPTKTTIGTIGPNGGLVLNGGAGGTGFNTSTGVGTVGEGTGGSNGNPGKHWVG